jgi:hypothetical protein
MQGVRGDGCGRSIYQSEQQTCFKLKEREREKEREGGRERDRERSCSQQPKDIIRPSLFHGIPEASPWGPSLYHRGLWGT